MRYLNFNRNYNHLVIAEFRGFPKFPLQTTKQCLFTRVFISRAFAFSGWYLTCSHTFLIVAIFLVCVSCAPFLLRGFHFFRTKKPKLLANRIKSSIWAMCKVLKTMQSAANWSKALILPSQLMRQILQTFEEISTFSNKLPETLHITLSEEIPRVLSFRIQINRFFSKQNFWAFSFRFLQGNWF